MANPTYFEKLKDPRWQKKRLAILERDNWSCQQCGANESTLHIHHRVYRRGKEPWEIEDRLLVTLCESCHEVEKEQWNEYGSDLIQMLKENFFGADISVIAGGFLNISMTRPSEVQASIIAWALQNEEVMNDLDKRYFKYLHEKDK